ncbi:MAG: hypothetical protein ABEJ55_02705 [Halanaeroarchaeum sp.]
MTTSLIVTGAVGALVAVGTFFPLRKMFAGTVPARASLLAGGLAIALGATALLAWDQVTWYRNAVLVLIGAFIALYLGIVSFERTGHTLD